MREARASELKASRRAELERSNAELEQFAYVASHDLQEPLRKVASFCQLLEQRYADQLDERGDQYIAFAVDGAKRMQQLINDLLAFSRVGRVAGGRASSSTSTRCCASALASLARRIEETGATVEVAETAADGAAARRRCWRSCFQNLIGNALKFRGDGGRRVVRVSAPPRRRASGSSPCADNGIGIEPEYADRIFVIFQRLHPRTPTPAPASGSRCAGRSSSTTAGGSGSTPTCAEVARFRFTLPVARRRAPPSEPRHQRT